MKRLLPIAFLLACVLVLPIRAHAQDSTPIAGGCTIAPMPWDHIMQLAGQAAASPVSEVTPTPMPVSSGSPVSEDTQAELMEVIAQMQACSHQQDLPRLLSLYTDRFIVEQFFQDEPVSIVLVISGTPIVATSEPPRTDQEQFLMDAVLLPDGRIAATVSGNAWGGNPQRYLFVQQDGRWLIDEIGPVSGDVGTGGTGNVTIPAAAQSVVDLVLADAAQQLGIELSALSIATLEAVEWPDAALGCPEEGGVYAQVVSPGYRIIVTDGSRTLEYHTGLNDAFVNCPA